MKKLFHKIKSNHLLSVSLFSLALAIFYIASTSSEHVRQSSLKEDDLYSKFIDQYQKNYAVYSLIIPDTVVLCGERVPTEYFDVYESLDRELHVNTFWHSQFFLYLKRANRFFPVIEPILKRNGVPDDFKYLCIAESGMTNAISPAGAAGFWQFIKGTGAKYGLIINDEIDERFHLEKSTEAACKYLKDMYKYYKSWSLVAAGYNMGQGGLDKHLKSQKVTNYYDLLLNEETARYVFRIISIKLIFENPKNFGFRYIPKQLYTKIPTEDIEVDSTITDLAEFSIKMGINYKLLKIFNPWLRQNQLTNYDSNKFIIKIPKEGFREMESLYGIFEYTLPADTIN